MTLLSWVITYNLNDETAVFQPSNRASLAKSLSKEIVSKQPHRLSGVLVVVTDPPWPPPKPGPRRGYEFLLRGSPTLQYLKMGIKCSSFAGFLHISWEGLRPLY